MVVLAFATVGTVYAATCTPATCVGPVFVTFSTPDCTGTPNFDSMNVEFDVCEDGELFETLSDGFTYYEFNNPTGVCDRDAANATFYAEFYKFGACTAYIPLRDSTSKSGKRGLAAAMYTSYMYLASVNDTIVPENFDNQPLPAFLEGNTQCESADNCTLDNGQPATAWMTQYDSYYTCETPVGSNMNPYQHYGECMNYYNFSYVKAGCFDSKGTFLAYYSDAACTKVTQIYGTRLACSGYNREIHCNAPITPFPGTAGPQSPPTPSAASSFSPFFLLVLAALIAILTAF